MSNFQRLAKEFLKRNNLTKPELYTQEFTRKNYLSASRMLKKLKQESIVYEMIYKILVFYISSIDPANPPKWIKSEILRKNIDDIPVPIQIFWFRKIKEISEEETYLK